jgi:acyl-phosphate glycerol 3-phosphate acyltransferase
MSHLAQLVLLVACSYLIGAIPFGYLVGRARGVDILRQGSGNIGATNVGRVLGRPLGILVFVCDFLKGALPAALGFWAAPPGSEAITPHISGTLSGLAAILGHMFPVFLRFRGGKGVATGAGVIFLLLPIPALVALLTWVAVALATRYVSLASLAAAALLCASRLILTHEPWSNANRILTLFTLVASGLIWIRHRENIQRLLHGHENRLKDSLMTFILGKTLHVLALAFWFGSTVFFTFVAAPIIFKTFGSLADGRSEGPDWLPATFSKDDGTQLAGLAVGPIFPWYFLLQGVCGVLALATAMAWTNREPSRKIHRIRFVVIIAALTTVLGHWPLAQKVSALRSARYAADAALAAAAKADFAYWHLCSLFLNFVTIALVGVAVALTANLPDLPREPVTHS